MKKFLGLSVVAAMAATSVSAMSNAQLAAKINDLENELATVKKQLKKQDKKINKVKAHDATDNIKWGVDLRTAIDSINYDMADGSSKDNSSLMTLRLYLNMAFNPDSHNIFKGQLAMNKAFGADFGMPPRAFGLGSMFDWTSNEALSDNTLKVKEAYWLYLGDSLFGSDLPWTFSIGRRPSIGGFLVNFREDDNAKSPLGHNINVEFDGLSTMVKLGDATGVDGMSFKICVGRGATDAVPMFDMNGEPAYADDLGESLDNIDLAGVIFVPYDDGQYKIMTNWFKAFNLPGMDSPMDPNAREGFHQYGDMQGAAISMLVDGLTEDGYFADAKVFASWAWSQTQPDDGNAMLGSTDDESGTSYWLGALLPVTDDSTFGIEYNHGSKYWRSFTYGEDTMIGSKLAARGDAYEAYYTYKINKALSAQIRYTYIDYEYTGSNGFFGQASGTPLKISDVKAGLYGEDIKSQVVEKAQDLRFYIRYRF
jgi:hypothetical protein